MTSAGKHAVKLQRRARRAPLRSAVVLLSGGIDSTTLLHYVVRNLGYDRVLALSFRYGQKHAREIQAARRQARRAGVAGHDVIDLAFFAALVQSGSALLRRGAPVPALRDLTDAQKRQPPTYVPNRNMILLALAAAFAEARGARDIYYGAQIQDEYGYWDCTTDFITRLNAALKLNRRNAVRVHAPFMGMRKADELRLGLALGVDYRHTWSCYRGGRRLCGTCPSCVERQRAFGELGIIDPLTAAES
jgi:7-cyano-7-deazaguanine synthase